MLIVLSMLCLTSYSQHGTFIVHFVNHITSAFSKTSLLSTCLYTCTLSFFRVFSKYSFGNLETSQVIKWSWTEKFLLFGPTKLRSSLFAAVGTFSCEVPLWFTAHQVTEPHVNHVAIGAMRWQGGALSSQCVLVNCHLIAYTAQL